jgi:hypothetical protein
MCFQSEGGNCHGGKGAAKQDAREDEKRARSGNERPNASDDQGQREGQRDPYRHPPHLPFAKREHQDANGDSRSRHGIQVEIGHNRTDPAHNQTAKREKRPGGRRRAHALTPREVETQEPERQAYVDADIQPGPGVI